MPEPMSGWFCKLCHQRMRRVYTWWTHVNPAHDDRCTCQHAYWADQE